MKANRERIRLLVDELRTTDKQQGKGNLCKIVDEVAEYCCLGVATELAMRHGVEIDVLEQTVGNTIYRDYDGRYGNLPTKVSNWFGFVDETDDEEGDDPILDLSSYRDRSCTTAIHANDYLHLTFAQIADAFEETYLRENSS